MDPKKGNKKEPGPKLLKSYQTDLFNLYITLLKENSIQIIIKVKKN